MKNHTGAVNQTLLSLNNICSMASVTSTAASFSQTGGHGGESTWQPLHGLLKGEE